MALLMPLMETVEIVRVPALIARNTIKSDLIILEIGSMCYRLPETFAHIMVEYTEDIRRLESNCLKKKNMYQAIASCNKSDFRLYNLEFIYNISCCTF